LYYLYFPDCIILYFTNYYSVFPWLHSPVLAGVYYPTPAALHPESDTFPPN
jgi:hypothetical protein